MTSGWGTFESIADGVKFFLFDGEVGFQFCEFLCMFVDFFRVIGYPTRCFGKRMFTLQ